MNESIAAFESELINKIQFKTTSKVSTDAFLFKSFKFFDLYNNGWLPKQDFFKAMAKCGVVVDTHDMDAIFQHYAQSDARLDYKLFIENLLFKDNSENNQRMSQSSLSQKIDPQSNPEQRPQSQHSDQHHSQHSEQHNNQPSDSRKQNGNSSASTLKLKYSKIDLIYNKCETYEEILETIKMHIRKQGITGLLAQGVNFKSLDSKKTHMLNRQQLRSQLPYLSEANVSTLMHEINPKSNEINFAYLIYKLKGQLGENEEKLIEEIFVRLDISQRSEIPIETLLTKNLSRQLLEEFGKCVELYCRFQSIDDGVFTDEDFFDFCGFLAFSFHSGYAFGAYMTKCYLEDDNISTRSVRSGRSRDFQSESRGEEHVEKEKIVTKKTKYYLTNSQADFRKNKANEPEHEKHSQPQKPAQYQTTQYQQQIDENLYRKSVSRYSYLYQRETNQFLKYIYLVILRIKHRLASKGTRGYLLFEKCLKNADANRDNLLTLDEFKQVIKDQRIDITNIECCNIFDTFDEQSTGFINFPEFMYTLRGQMPEHRKLLAGKLWLQVRRTYTSTTFATIKQLINFKGHPDIQNGRRYEYDIFKEIQYTILIIQDLNGTPRSETVSKVEFDEYVYNLSLAVLDDKLFESIMFNFWKVNTSINIQEQYAGSRKLFDPTKNGYLMDHHRYVVKGGSVSQNAPFGTSHEPTNYFTYNRKL